MKILRDGQPKTKSRVYKGTCKCKCKFEVYEVELIRTVLRDKEGRRYCDTYCPYPGCLEIVTVKEKVL